MDVRLNLSTIVLGLLVILVLYIIKRFTYWKVRGVDSLWKLSIFTDPISFNEPYNYYKWRGNKYLGLFFITKPALMLFDLNLIKHVMSIDFQNFHSRGLVIDERDPLSANLFGVSGNQWKQLRVKFTPTFTSGKMKMMFQTLVDCSKSMEVAIQNNIKDKLPTDMKAICRGFTTNVIGSVAFGIECNGFDETSLFRKYGEKIFQPNFIRIIKTRLYFLFPTFARTIGINTRVPDLSEFFENLVKNIVEYRDKNNYRRQDFMQLLIDLKNNKSLDDEPAEENTKPSLSLKDITAQAFLFFAAGFETSSATMNFCLYELAVNQDIQGKVRNEIVKVLAKHNNELTYESISEMKYLGQVVDETLRKYPPIGLLPRKCMEDYKIPDTNMTIKEGTMLVIPIYHIHHDPEYYENPETFDPDRFNVENRDKIPPFAYLPFGEGPRICIGLRFGLMQAKIGLVALLKQFQFTLNEKTPEILEFNRNSFTLAFNENVYMNVTELQK